MTRTMRFLEILGWRVFKIMLGLLALVLLVRLVAAHPMSKHAQDIMAAVMVCALLLLLLGLLVGAVTALVRDSWHDAAEDA